MRASPASASSQKTWLTQPRHGVGFEPQFGAARVRLQAFAVGQFGGDRAQRLRARFAHVDDRRALLEIVHAQRRREARGARGRQHVVRAAAVVAQRLGREAAEEHGAGVADLVGPLLRILGRDFQVLGGDGVGDGAGFVHVAHLDQRAAVGQRGADDVCARHGRQQLVDAGFDLGDVVGVGAQQDRLRQLVVLGLREQVHRDPVRIGGAVAQHQDFRRAGDHVDADRAEHAALGGGHVGVAGADDLVDRRQWSRCRRPARRPPARRRW